MFLHVETDGYNEAIIHASYAVFETKTLKPILESVHEFPLTSRVETNEKAIHSANIYLHGATRIHPDQQIPRLRLPGDTKTQFITVEYLKECGKKA